MAEVFSDASECQDVTPEDTEQKWSRGESIMQLGPAPYVLVRAIANRLGRLGQSSFGTHLGHSIMPRVAVGYSRVSTQEQAREGVSLDAQAERIQLHALAHDLDLVACHEDSGISGRKASNRPGLEAAIEEVTQHRGVLIVYSLSRLARSVRDCIDIASQLERAGAQLVLLVDQIDTSTATGRMFFHVLAALAQFESDLNGERVRAALDYTRAKGRQYCLNAPYGYSFEDGKIVPNEEEQKTKRRIRSLRAKGWSYRRIERKLRETGVRNRRGNPLPFQAIATIDKQVEDAGIRRPAKRRRRGQ